jgi:hypothetical protein
VADTRAWAPVARRVGKGKKPSAENVIHKTSPVGWVPSR